MNMNILKKLFGSRGSQESPAEVLFESVHGTTDVGMDRDNNEDYFLVNLPKNLFIVADGMGGHNAGEVASLNATEAVNDHFTPEILADIKGDKIKINDEAAVQKFFVSQGVSAEDFKKTFNSFAVNIKVNNARQMTRRYASSGVPMLVVNGKYATSQSMAHGSEAAIKVVNYLMLI